MVRSGMRRPPSGHIVYAGVLMYLIIKRAGHVLGLDGLFAEHSAVKQALVLRWMVA